VTEQTKPRSLLRRLFSMNAGEHAEAVETLIFTIVRVCFAPVTWLDDRTLRRLEARRHQRAVEADRKAAGQ
jgi:hypothetical protein